MKILLLISFLAFSACQNVVQGPIGPKGDAGVSGPVGGIGPRGDSGTNGSDGKSLVATTIPATIEQCPTGGSLTLVSQDTLNTGVWDITDVLQTSFLTCNGLVGSTGERGEIGLTGNSGTNGINATPIVPIQFCPNVTPTYPSQFPEYGLLINGVIYGVYSENGGFLAALPSGRYSSNGAGNHSQCDFTISSNGTISYEQ